MLPTPLSMRYAAPHQTLSATNTAKTLGPPRGRACMSLAMRGRSKTASTARRSQRKLRKGLAKRPDMALWLAKPPQTRVPLPLEMQDPPPAQHRHRMDALRSLENGTPRSPDARYGCLYVRLADVSVS